MGPYELRGGYFGWAGEPFVWVAWMEEESWLIPNKMIIDDDLALFPSWLTLVTK